MSFHKKIKSSSSYISLVLQDATLENENIKNGDTLIVEEGRLPPKVINLQTKDFLSLTTFTQKSPCDVQCDRVFLAILFFFLAGISSSFIVANKIERTKLWRRSHLDYIGYTRSVDLVIIIISLFVLVWDAKSSWLVRWVLDRAIRVRVVAWVLVTLLSLSSVPMYTDKRLNTVEPRYNERYSMPRPNLQ